MSGRPIKRTLRAGAGCVQLRVVGDLSRRVTHLSQSLAAQAVYKMEGLGRPVRPRSAR